MKATKKNQNKNKNEEQKSFISTLTNAIKETEDLDNILETITLKRPRPSFSIFICENYENERLKDEKLNMVSIVKKLGEKWSKLLKSEKEKYEKKSEEEKEKYKHDLETIKHYFFSEYNQYGTTAYRLFLNERLKQAFGKDEDIKTTKKKAMEDWKKLSKEEKKEWNLKKKENDTWWEKAKQLRCITPYAVFIQKHIEDCKNKKQEIPNFKEISKVWSHLSNKEKNKYYEYSNEMNEEWKKRRDFFEIIHGIRPKRPAGAYKIFLSEKAKEGCFKGKVNIFKEGKKLWENLSEDVKNSYLKKARKIKLCYIYRRLLYRKNIKNLLPKKPPNAFNLFFISLKGITVPKGKRFYEIVNEKWKNISQKEKKSFEEKAEIERKKYEEKMKKFENRIFDEPKKPKGPFPYFLTEKMAEIKKENKNLNFKEIIHKCAETWKDLEEKKKEKYYKLSEKDRERYNAQNEQFNEFGYYVKNHRKVRSSSKEKKDKKEKKISFPVSEKKRSKLIEE